jgi:hypothetical protein
VSDTQSFLRKKEQLQTSDASGIETGVDSVVSWHCVRFLWYAPSNTVHEMLEEYLCGLSKVLAVFNGVGLYKSL